MIELLPKSLLLSFIFVYRAQKTKFTLLLFTDWFGGHFIITSMYSQFMFTIVCKIYRLLRPTYLATSFQEGVSLVSSLSLVNVCREIQEISCHSPKVFIPKLRTTSAPSSFELCGGGKEPMEPVFSPCVCICVCVAPAHTCKSLHLYLHLHRTCGLINGVRRTSYVIDYIVRIWQND